MLVSIVIPIFRPNLDYFRSLIATIARQTITNFEVIISDDEDDEQNVKAILLDFPQLSFVYSKNIDKRGIFSNLNNAISKSSGRLVQICCQDDIMYPGLLEIHINRLQAHPEAGLCFSNFDSIDKQNNVQSLERKHDLRKSWPSIIPIHQTANYLLAYGCMPGNLSPVMLRRTTITAIGLFDQNFSFAGDFEYWSRCAGFCAFAYNAQPYLAIRRHEHQASRNLSIKDLQRDYLSIYNNLLAKSSLKKVSGF